MIRFDSLAILLMAPLLPRLHLKYSLSQTTVAAIASCLSGSMVMLMLVAIAYGKPHLDCGTLHLMTWHLCMHLYMHLYDVAPLYAPLYAPLRRGTSITYCTPKNCSILIRGKQNENTQGADSPNKPKKRWRPVSSTHSNKNHYS